MITQEGLIDIKGPLMRAKRKFHPSDSFPVRAFDTIFCFSVSLKVMKEH